MNQCGMSLDLLLLLLLRRVSFKTWRNVFVLSYMVFNRTFFIEGMRTDSLYESGSYVQRKSYPSLTLFAAIAIFIFRRYVKESKRELSR